MKWDTVAIVGVGLLGGSIGLALQQRKLARQVIGIGRRASSLRKSRRAGAITTSTTRLSRGVADAQLIIVCTPVADIVPRVLEAAEHCPAGARITDVGSTKVEIVKALRHDLSGRVTFIGSHPMAGSQKAGSENAVASLLDGKVTVVTPTSQSCRTSTEEIEGLWSSLGARVLRMTPRAHDKIVAMTSHTPHLVAAALAAATPAKDLPLAASGWQDTTRIAAGDAQLWQQILFSNRDHVLKSLDRFERVLAKFRSALERDDKDRIVELLEAGKQIRDTVGS